MCRVCRSLDRRSKEGVLLHSMGGAISEVLLLKFAFAGVIGFVGFVGFRGFIGFHRVYIRV